MLKKVRVDEARLGMHLHALDGAWLDHPFWRSQFVLRDPADLARLRDSRVQAIWIDTAKGLDVAASAEPSVRPRDQAQAHTPLPATALASTGSAAAAAPSAPAGAAPVTTTSLAEESERAAVLVGQARGVVTGLYREARMGRALDIGGCAELVDEVTSSVWRNPDAMLSLVRLKSHDDYTYMHSVAVCALMIALARQLELGTEAAREAGMAGLLHDMGKVAMPHEVLSKPGKLTEAEFQVMRSHPERGHALLLGRVTGPDPALDGISQGVLDVCLHHHERIDGKGYPHGLAGEQISPLARMGAVCDVYDAITSNRPYKAAWDPSESIGRMASWRAGHFDEPIFQAFVRSLGIYPIGSLVRLESQRLAVVIEQNRQAITRPRVRVFFSARSGLPVPLEVLDLAADSCSDRIAGRESNREWKFPHLDSLWAGADLLRKRGSG